MGLAEQAQVQGAQQHAAEGAGQMRIAAEARQLSAGVAQQVLEVGIQLRVARCFKQTRQQLQKMVPYVVAFTAILLIVRGLNLNIPYISPFLSERSIDTVSCH